MNKRIFSCIAVNVKVFRIAGIVLANLFVSWFFNLSASTSAVTFLLFQLLKKPHQGKDKRPVNKMKVSNAVFR
jgi:hypothetical protein